MLTRKISIVVLLCLIGFTIFYEMHRFPYPELLADKKGEYAYLLMFGEEMRFVKDGENYYEWPQGLNNPNFTKGRTIDDINTFPKLEIEKNPVLIIFNHKEVVLKTYDLEEAEDFIEKNMNYMPSSWREEKWHP